MLYKSVTDFRDTNRFSIWRWPNFTPEELACKCKRKHCEGEYYHDAEFLDALQALRDVMKYPLKINSAHRCAGHNKAVGGSPVSRHLRIAVDIDLPAHIDREKLYAEAIREGFTGIGRYETFIHLDRRPGKARWWGGEKARAYWPGSQS